MNKEVNMALAAITTDVPDYTAVRNEFFEHFPLFWKLGPVNYACLPRYTGFSGVNGQLVAVYLCGLAMAKLSAYSENYRGDEDIWNPLFAWTMVEGEIAYIRPLLKLPAAVEMPVPEAPKRRRRTG